jgi:hypothetical protein
MDQTTTGLVQTYFRHQFGKNNHGMERWEKRGWKGGGEGGVTKMASRNGEFIFHRLEFAAASTSDKWLHYLRGMDVNSGADVPPRLRHDPLMETGGAKRRIPIPWERSSSLHLFLRSLYLHNCELLVVYFSRSGLRSSWLWLSFALLQICTCCVLCFWSAAAVLAIGFSLSVFLPPPPTRCQHGCFCAFFGSLSFWGE